MKIKNRKAQFNMTQTATIYYHKPRIRKTNTRKDAFDSAQYNLVHMSLESQNKFDSDIKNRTPDPVVSGRKEKALLTECTVPMSSVFNCCVTTLRSLGLTGKYDGFSYICRAVEEILKDKEQPHFQSIYYDIGKEYEVNSSSVERSIRYSISYIKRSGNRPTLAAVLGDALGDEKNFSNSKFLTILAADVYEKLTALDAE